MKRIDFGTGLFNLAAVRLCALQTQTQEKQKNLQAETISGSYLVDLKSNNPLGKFI